MFGRKKKVSLLSDAEAARLQDARGIGRAMGRVGAFAQVDPLTGRLLVQLQGQSYEEEGQVLREENGLITVCDSDGTVLHIHKDEVIEKSIGKGATDRRGFSSNVQNPWKVR
jgi:hypothetical protein